MTKGTVSQATLEAGGYAHGIIPRALTTRASEVTGAAFTDPSHNVKSVEGAGDDIMAENNYDGRFTTSLTDSMHSVSQRPLKGVRIVKGLMGHSESSRWP
jgi:hypothetical protein